MKVYIITRKKRTPEEIERRAKIRELLQVSNISSMADIQNLLKETIAEFMENNLDAELDDELGYSTTIQPVRRTFPNSTIHIVSNTWEGSFLPFGQKFPHEPRSEQSAMLPRPSESFLSRRQLAAQVICVEPYFSHRNLLRNRSIGPRCTSHALLLSA